MITKPTKLKLAALGAFAVVYIIVFWATRSGVGNNWDWIFPYFKGYAPELFWKDISSWSDVGLGAAQSYAPSVLYQFLLLPFYYLPLQPEYIIFLLLVVSFSLGSFLVFWRLNKRVNNISALLIGLAVFINPAIFYKLLAGHLVYIGAYIAYVGLVFYLLDYYRPTVRSSLTLGLLFALSAVQAQFLVFSLITVVLFFLLHKQLFSLRLFALSMLVVALIHLYWVSNFLLGSVSVSEVGKLAQDSTFSQLERTSFFNIFRLTFSDATFISRFYSRFAQFAGLALTGLMLVLLAKKNSDQKQPGFFYGQWVVFVIIAAGAYRDFAVPVVSKIYPLLREAGHAAPLVIFSLLLAVVFAAKSKIAIGASQLAVALVLAFSLVTFTSSLPLVDYQKAREELSQYNAVSDNSTYRVITYPFYNQYTFRSQPQNVKQGTPMSNTGWDSFTIFLGREYIDNSTSNTGVQNQLLDSYDLSALEPYNVKYIYDLSGVYRSSADKFLPLSQYSLDKIKKNNDISFIEKLIERNPGGLYKISDNIYAVSNYRPRIDMAAGKFWRTSRTEYLVQPDKLAGGKITLRSTFHKGWELSIEPRADLSCNVVSEGNVTECLGTNFNKNKASSKTVLSHIKDKDGLNVWLLDPSQVGSQYQYRISFQPDAMHRIALMVSLTTLLSVATLTILVSRKKHDAQ